MPARGRYNERELPGGTFGRFGVTDYSGDVKLESNSCMDTVHAPDNGPLHIEHFEVSGGKINKPSSDGFYDPHFEDYLADGLRDYAGFPHISPLPGKLSDLDYGALAASRTNLSHPKVDVPANILELPDTVHLLLNSPRWLTGGMGLDNQVRKGRAYRSLYYGSKAAGTTNITYQFGIAPVVGDLAGLLDIHGDIQRKIDGFNKLQGKTGFRKTVNLGSFDVSDERYMTLQSNRAFINVPVKIRTKQWVRGHVRWLPDNYPNQLYSPATVRAMARRAALGLEGPLGLGFSSLWEAVPWSWLIDWCSNLGAYLDAQRNALPAKLGGVSIIERTLTEYTGPSYYDGNLHMGDWMVTRESKQRRLTGVIPHVHMPFLSGTQMGILASLLTARA